MQVVGHAAAAPVRAPAALGWSPAWTIESVVPTGLVLSAGADRRVLVDGLQATTIERARGWPLERPITATDDEAHLLLDRLVELGAVTVAAPAATRVRLRWIGPADDAVVDALRAADLDVVAGDTADGSGDGAGPATTIAVRTGPGPVPPLDGPHLGVDLTLHHTVLLGPFVVPATTACLGCLDQRQAHRWGRPAIPARPRVRRHLAAVADLVAIQVELAAGGRSPLVNATVAWDLEQGTTDRQSLYKLAGCPTCDVARPSGRVALPWVPA